MAGPRPSDRGDPWNRWLFSEPDPLLKDRARPLATAPARFPLIVGEPLRLE
jgi:hypothetical protein